ncbi:MAG: energy-coupling factor transporter transmembrane protein EcfT [Oscillospiraceae bacterium]|nr:energy-coupling factor transporter transmembrane protein EcfT [Oscillospiraceae bacterium]
MRSRDAFSACHPVVNLVYFTLVLLFSMCWMHPACLGISLAGATACVFVLRGGTTLGKSLLRLLPIALLAAVVNPAFNHEGVTILTYLPGGNPLTLESILFGLASAGMLMAVLLWFSCTTCVMTSDKWVYLFGRVIPALSLVLSMTLRFVPKFRQQFQIVRETLPEDGGVLRRMRTLVTVFSIVVTWSLENAVETADSMKSRGYGLPGRTAFSIYRMDSRDKRMLIWLGACALCLGSGWLLGGADWRYYPAINGASVAPTTVGFWCVYLALCFTPVVLCWREERTWNLLQSKI